MKIAYIILAHDQPRLVARLVNHLLDADGLVSVHFDLKAGDAPVTKLKEIIASRTRDILWCKREAVIWGEWSLVQATLNALQSIARSGQRLDFVYLLSGADYPIRPIGDLKAFLDRHKDIEFIESVDAERETWITRGIQQERYLYRHPFNWRSHPRLFDLALNGQKILGLKREFPAGFTPHIGSQWWVLTWSTCMKILKLVENKALVGFFKGTWVPDELFFQTLVRSVAESACIRGRPLTHYQFSDYGVPIVFYNGHASYLARQPFFFARKLSPYADELRDELDAVVAGRVPCRKVQDPEVGKISDEYENHRLSHGKGLFGKRIMGWIRDPWSGDLEWNQRPYFVVIGHSSRELKLIQDILNHFDGLLCHGELFRPEAIAFAADQDRFAGFSRQDTRLRDHAKNNFIVQVIHETPGQMTGYLLRHGQGKEMHQIHAWDPNARVIVVKGDPIRSFLEGRNAPGKGETQNGFDLESASEVGFSAEAFVLHYERSLLDYQALKKNIRNGASHALWIDLNDYKDISLGKLASRLQSFLLGSDEQEVDPTLFKEEIPPLLPIEKAPQLIAARNAIEQRFQ